MFSILSKKKEYKINTHPSLHSALKSVVAGNIIGHFNQTSNISEHITEISRLSGYSEKDILYSCAQSIGLPLVEVLSTPTNQLISKTGHSPETLHSRNIIPQPSGSQSHYYLVVSDHEAINYQAYIDSGIQVCLAHHQDIKNAWTSYFNALNQKECSFKDETIEHAVCNLVKSAQKLLANSIRFFSSNNNYFYKFDGGDETYKGKIHSEMYSYIASQSSNSINEKLFSFRKNPECYKLNRVSTNDESYIEIKWPSSTINVKKTATTATQATSLNPDKKITALLLDDDPRFQKVACCVLEKKGWQVITYNEGRKALKHLSKSSSEITMIICDVHMPTMDGVEFLDSLRKINENIPILFLTSDEDPLLEAELALKGANAFVRKQDDPRVLLAWCTNLASQTLH